MHRAGRSLTACFTIAAIGVGVAGEARATDWVSTATHAFVPSYLAATAGKAPTALRTELAQASALASPASGTMAVAVTVALMPRDETALTARADAVAAGRMSALSRAEFLAQFAPSEASVDAVTSYLRSNGFSDVVVAPNRLLVTANGTASAVQSAFNTPLDTYRLGTGTAFANRADAQVPASLATTVGSVLGLQTLVRPRTDVRVGPMVARRAASNVAHVPTDFPKIYDASSVATASKTKVGIITWGTLTKVQTDLATAARKDGYATPSNTVVKTNSSGSYVYDADSDIEWDLDSQTILGTTGGAVGQIVFYSAPNGGQGTTDADITGAFNRAVSDDVVKVINVSLGSDEAGAHSDGTQSADDTVFKSAVAQGQTFSVSSGDEGVYEHTQGVITDANGNIDVDLSKYSVSEPATSPYVIAVGGTTLSTSGTTTYSGETVWNEGLSYVDDYDDTQRLYATGGGVSMYEAAPAWQKTAFGTGTTYRVLPDIAFDAAQSTGALIVYHGSTEQVGGTSLASPIFVGFWARIESAKGNALGFPASGFYKNLPGSSGVVHDVVSGNNGYDGYGYTAASGYDKTTGFGSFDVAKLYALIGASTGF